MNVREFVEENRTELELDNPTDAEDVDNAGYYTMSKIMLDVSDFYENGQEEVKAGEVKLMNRSLYTIRKL